jgi:hypothetical protein
MKTLIWGLSRPLAWLGYEVWPRRGTRPVDGRAPPAPDQTPRASLERDVERMREDLETLVFTTKILCGLITVMVLALVVVALKVD